MRSIIRRHHWNPDAWLDRLARGAARLPGGRAAQRWLRSHPGGRRAIWFAGLYALSVVAFAAVAFLLESLVPR